MEYELQALEQALAESNQALGFFTMLLGALIGAVVSYMGASGLSEMQKFFFKFAFAALALGTLWFGVTWYRKSNRRNSLLQKIRGATTS